MKNLVLALTLAVTMLAALPVHKAHAGVAWLIQSDSRADSWVDIGNGGSLNLGGAAADVVIVAGMMVLTKDLGTGAILIVLDSGRANSSALAEGLKRKFPFLDDETVVENLTAALEAGYEAVKDSNGNAYVTLSQDEIRDIVSTSDLSENEFQTLVNELN